MPPRQRFPRASPPALFRGVLATRHDAAAATALTTSYVTYLEGNYEAHGLVTLISLRMIFQQRGTTADFVNGFRVLLDDVQIWPESGDEESATGGGELFSIFPQAVEIWANVGANAPAVAAGARNVKVQAKATNTLLYLLGRSKLHVIEFP